MKFVIWLLLLATIGAACFVLWRWQRRWSEQKRAAEARFTSFIAQASPRAQASPGVQASHAAQAAPADAAGQPQQQLLLEAAAKSAQAGEPVLSIQLYARLLARYPNGSLAAQARAAVEEQKKKARS
jgi:hypothetical protein